MTEPFRDWAREDGLFQLLLLGAQSPIESFHRTGQCFNPWQSGWGLVPMVQT
jgi:hypothetical protein